MPTYYLYPIDAAGHIRSRIEIDCDTDEEAIAVARNHKREHVLELWRTGRLVLRLEPPTDSDEAG